MRSKKVRIKVAGAFAVSLAVVSMNCLATGASMAASGEKAFRVANFPVEARAANAVAAKKAAIDDGQTAALRSLLKRIVPVMAYERLRQVGPVDAAQYIEGIAVRAEQNSATEYYASLDFSFSPDGVRDLLRQRGVPFIDAQAPLSTLVPVLLGADEAPQRSSGSWGQVWKALDVKNALAPLSIAPLRPTIHRDVFEGLAQGDDSRGMRILASEYGSERVMVATAEVDRATSRLMVNVVGRDGVGEINWSRSYRIYDGDAAYAMELAAVVTLGVLEGRWKSVKARQSGGLGALAQPASLVRIEVLFGSAREWYGLQRKLSDLSGAGQFRVNSVAARSADVELVYPGGGSGLANTLARQGYALSDEGGRWVLRQRF